MAVRQDVARTTVIMHMEEVVILNDDSKIKFKFGKDFKYHKSLNSLTQH